MFALVLLSPSSIILEADSVRTDSILSDAIPTNAIPTEIYVDRHSIMFYMHIYQGATISCEWSTILHLVLKLWFLFTVPIRVKVRVMFRVWVHVRVSVFQTFM